MGLNFLVQVRQLTNSRLVNSNCLCVTGRQLTNSHWGCQGHESQTAGLQGRRRGEMKDVEQGRQGRQTRDVRDVRDVEDVHGRCQGRERRGREDVGDVRDVRQGRQGRVRRRDTGL